MDAIYKESLWEKCLKLEISCMPQADTGFGNLIVDVQKNRDSSGKRYLPAFY